MNKNIKYIAIIAGVVIVVIFTAFKLASNKRELDAKIYHPDINVSAVIQAEKVKESAFVESKQFLGTFAPNHKVTISSETAGKVIEVNFEEGANVSVGATIARLDDGLLQAQLSSAKANYEYASTALTRYEQATAGVTQLQLDNAKTQKRTSQAQIDQLNKQISQYIIKAPFSGIITKKSVELGAIVSPGTPFATLIDISSLKLEVSVPENYISKFKSGEALNLKTDVYPDVIFKGKVILVGSQADDSHNYDVKVWVANSTKVPLKAGMYGSLTIDNSASANGISVSRSALIGSSEKPQVYVVENGIVKLRAIQIGASNETNVQIVNGLKAGEIVAVGGLVNLTDGVKVEIR